MHTVGGVRDSRRFSVLKKRLKKALDSRAGRVTLATVLGGSFTFLAFFVFFSLEVRVPRVNADDVTTSVTILNTPPQWTVDAEEKYESSVTVPTNVGTSSQWVATATDSNNDNYWLIICKTAATPTPHINSAPTCSGGISDTWALSATTASGSQAQAATTTLESFPESNDWYAYVCDGNSSLPQCNATAKQGTGSTASPFIVNHPPVFASVSNDGPVNPGGTVSWTTVAYDTDTLTTNTVRVLLCKANDFTQASGACGVGGTWATSTLAASNPATSTPIATPYQDKTYNAYAYLVDAFGLPATSTVQATNSSFTVNNVAPSVSAAGVSIVDPATAGRIQLTVPAATSGPYRVQFIVTDNNSCLNSSSGQEISSATTSIYRSGIGQSSCQLSTDQNSNSCYPSAYSGTHITCVQDTAGTVTGDSCAGATDSTVGWYCTFSLWYNADPTYPKDGSTQYGDTENWLASVQVTDDNTLLSPISESSSGNDIETFLAFDIPQTALWFGALQPGDTTDPLATTTTLVGQGNIGLDQDIYGDTMCTTWTAPDSCDSNGVSVTNDITVDKQKVATSSVAYADSFAYALSGSTTPVTVGINVPKTTATDTPEQKTNYWGITIQSGLTVAGAYKGQDTITAITSNPANW